MACIHEDVVCCLCLCGTLQGQACVAWIGWTKKTSVVASQAVQLGSTQVSAGQLLGAAAVTGLLTYAAVAERKAIRRYVLLHSIPKLLPTQSSCLLAKPETRLYCGYSIHVHLGADCSSMNAGLQQSQPIGSSMVW